MSSRHVIAEYALTDLLPWGYTGDIPSFKLFESEKVFAFLDIQPLSRGHAVRITSYPSSPHPACSLWRGAKLPKLP